jgi:hypothetical protein
LLGGTIRKVQVSLLAEQGLWLVEVFVDKQFPVKGHGQVMFPWAELQVGLGHDGRSSNELVAYLCLKEAFDFLLMSVSVFWSQ